MLGAQSGVVPEVSAKVRSQGLRISPKSESEPRQPQQRRNFGRGENILNRRPCLHAENIDDRQKDHEQDRHQVLGIDADFHVSQNHQADMNGRDLPQMQEPVRRRDRRNEHSEELAESHSAGPDRSSLNDEEESPAVEKSPKGSK